MVDQPSESDSQQLYAMMVLSLVNVARQIRGDQGDELASHVEGNMARYLEVMLDFDDTPLTIATFYAAGKLLEEAGEEAPSRITERVKELSGVQERVLSEKCFKPLSVCAATDPNCVPWPTSLRPVDTDEEQPYTGWRYITGSHCGFSWPNFWDLDCGEPLGLYNCDAPARGKKG